MLLLMKIKMIIIIKNDNDKQADACLMPPDI